MKLEIGETGNEFTSWQKRYQIWSGTILIKGTKRFKNTVGYQIIRSSDSIAANIAEGYGRYTPVTVIPAKAGMTVFQIIHVSGP
ncbi:MAG: four helix bundle protein, partial [Thermodesulfobacteriota bacterium]|nr:four helix bundle protein [Thermodesulfobacteriota bacterium]